MYATVTVYNQLWSWVDQHCPAGMSQLNCQGCYDYSGASVCVFIMKHMFVYLLCLLIPPAATFCSADEPTCYAFSDGDGEACAYTQCRSGVLKYLSTRIM